MVSQWLGHGSKTIHTIGKLEAAEALARAAGVHALWLAKGIGPRIPAATLAKAEAPARQSSPPPQAPSTRAASTTAATLRIICRARISTPCHDRMRPS